LVLLTDESLSHDLDHNQ